MYDQFSWNLFTNNGAIGALNKVFKPKVTSSVIWPGDQHQSSHLHGDHNHQIWIKLTHKYWCYWSNKILRSNGIRYRWSLNLGWIPTKVIAGWSHIFSLVKIGLQMWVILQWQGFNVKGHSTRDFWPFRLGVNLKEGSRMLITCIKFSWNLSQTFIYLAFIPSFHQKSDYKYGC